MHAVLPALPRNRHFLTQLFDSLSSVRDASIDRIAIVDQANTNTNPLHNVPDATKKQLLSLQVLFPNEFVPALDLLDRRLITRFHIRDEEETPTLLKTVQGETNAGAGQDIQMQDAEDALPSPLQHQDAQINGTRTTYTHTIPNPPTTYHVRSAQQRPSRYSTSYDTTTSYQVRLQSWNCSCPAFAFAAFPAVHPEPPTPLHNPIQQQQEEEEEEDQRGISWIFGGITLGDDMPPVCKHLLACVLVARCSGLFAAFVEDKHVSVEEAAGWAAGWGD